MKKFYLILSCFFFLIFNLQPGYCFLDKVFKKGDPFERGSEAYDSGDYATAIKEWKSLAEEGNTAAQWNLYLSYQKKNKYEKADYWLNQAAKNGYERAQCRVARIYQNKEKYRKAVYWYTKAAQKGNSWAQYCLGSIYKKGRGVLQDLEKTRQLYTQAALQGESMAQRDLGEMFYEGEGGPIDFIQAYAWWTLFATYDENTHEFAEDLRDIYRSKAQDLIDSKGTNKKMTPEEINKAKNLTKELYSKIYGELTP